MRFFVVLAVVAFEADASQTINHQRLESVADILGYKGVDIVPDGKAGVHTEIVRNSAKGKQEFEFSKENLQLITEAQGNADKHLDWLTGESFDCKAEGVLKEGKQPNLSSCRALKYCIGGMCKTITNTSSNDMYKSIAALWAINGIGKESSTDGDYNVFKGVVRSCRIDAASSRDCCKNSGWAVDSNLAQCSEGEKILAKQKQNNSCHFIGSYCAKKIGGFCRKKRQSYCCFGSKLGKIIQVEGRKQLGLNWGKAKAPNCRSLTLEQIQKLDFSKIDLSELYEDIDHKIKVVSDLEVLRNSEKIIKQKMESHYAK